MVHRLYSDLAAWWPLFPPSGYYEQEATSVTAALAAACVTPPRHILELGSGGGSMAAHLRDYAELTLVEREDAMLQVSRRLNPGVTHHKGDMRSVRLGRSFDAIIIHDAINYITREDDLIATLATARAHLEPGGVAMVAPDDTCESFAPSSGTGGQDSPDGNMGLRYLSWSHAVNGTSYTIDFALMLRSSDGTVELVHDRHFFGLFPCETWRGAFMRAGFGGPHVRSDRWRQHVFLAQARAP
jgi:SAM-dependent methyltransferase